MIETPIAERGNALSLKRKLFIFLVGASSAFIFTFVGNLYLLEIVFCAVVPLSFLRLVRALAANKILKRYFLFSILMLLGLLLSDIVSGAFALKRWGHYGLQIVDILALYILIRGEKSALAFFIGGVAVGFGFTAIQHPFAGGGIMKRYYAIPLMYLFTLVFAFFPMSQLVVITELCFIGLAFLYFDSRSYAGMGLGSACCIVSNLYLRTKQSIIILLMALVGCLGIFYVGYTTYMSTNKSFEARREESNAGRYRVFVTGLEQIMEQPFLGKGTKVRSGVLVDEDGPLSIGFGEEYHGAHSQLLSSWLEGGVLTAIFFIYFGVRCVKSLVYLAKDRAYDNYTAIMTLIMIQSLWYLLQNPFAGRHRIIMAIAISIHCCLHRETSSGRSPDA